MSESDFNSEMDMSGAEREQLTQLSELLQDARPIPDPQFRGRLRRALVPAGSQSRASYSFRVIANTLAGGLCLLVAALGLVGVGPFAA